MDISQKGRRGLGLDGGQGNILRNMLRNILGNIPGNILGNVLQNVLGNMHGNKNENILENMLGNRIENVKAISEQCTIFSKSGRRCPILFKTVTSNVFSCWGLKIRDFLEVCA